MSRRDQIRMTDAQTRAFLEAGRDLQVASINADGTPHLVTMWYEIDGGDLCFWTYGKSQKVVNLRRDPRLTVLVATGAVYEELKGVSITGTAEIAEPGTPEVLAFGRRLFDKYWGVSGVDTATVGIESQAQKRVLIRVKATSTVTWDHSKLAGAY
jgi:PPOX class probable F420-dependent enzyme